MKVFLTSQARSERTHGAAAFMCPGHFTILEHGAAVTTTTANRKLHA